MLLYAPAICCGKASSFSCSKTDVWVEMGQQESNMPHIKMSPAPSHPRTIVALSLAIPGLFTADYHPTFWVET